MRKFQEVILGNDYEGTWDIMGFCDFSFEYYPKSRAKRNYVSEPRSTFIFRC